MSKFKALEIGNKIAEIPIIQGGMGVGVSTPEMAGANAAQGAVGTISATLASHIESIREGRKIGTCEAVCAQVKRAKQIGNYGLIGVNIMIALPNDFKESIQGAIDGEANFIFLGAGLPLNLPIELVEKCREKNISLVPIVSSARAMKIICSRWLSNLNYLPDAIILEGPRAGGHLGFKNPTEIVAAKNNLEDLLKEVLQVKAEYQNLFGKNIKVVSGGGILRAEDIDKYLKLGADGVQMGTLFVASQESGAKDDFKQMLLECKLEDILVAYQPYPASPCGLPFRVIRSSPGYLAAENNEVNPPCVGYLCSRDENGKFIECPALHDKNFFCICNVLLAAINIGPGKGIYTVGARAAEVREIYTEIMGSKKGYPTIAQIITWLVINYENLN